MGDTPTGLWQLETGYVSLRTFTAEGRSCLVRLVCGGEIFGYAPLLRGRPYEFAAETLSQSRIRYIPAAVVQSLKETDPAIARSLEASLAAAHHATQQRMIEMMTSTAEARFLSFCETIGRIQGEQVSGAFSLQIPFAFKDIADVIGISPEAMSRLLRKLKNDGAIVHQTRTTLWLSEDWSDHWRAARARPPMGTPIGFRSRSYSGLSNTGAGGAL